MLEVVVMDASSWTLLILGIIGLLLIIFWIVEFIDMLGNKKLRKDTRLILAILFLVFSLISAIVYYIWKKMK